MKYRRNLLFIVLGLVIALGGVGYYFFYQLNPAQKSKLLKNIPFIQQDDVIKQFEIIDQVNNLTYNFDPSIHDNPRVLAVIKGTDVDRFKKKVIIHSDPINRGTSILEQGKVIAGYKSRIDYNNELVEIFIYINPELTDRQKVLNKINSGYIGALLSAVEINKKNLDPTYIPDYAKMMELTHEISVENYDNQYSFITYADPE